MGSTDDTSEGLRGDASILRLPRAALSSPQAVSNDGDASLPQTSPNQWPRSTTKGDRKPGRPARSDEERVDVGTALQAAGHHGKTHRLRGQARAVVQKHQGDGRME